MTATEITFWQKQRPTARYVSGTTVREEAIDHTRVIGAYWSGSGYVDRENSTDNLPQVDSLQFKTQVFDLEIDGQELHNHWELISTGEQAGERPGVRVATVELQHQIRPIRVKIVTTLDGTSFLARHLEITNTGETSATLSRVSPWSGMLWTSEGDLKSKDVLSLARPDVPSPFTLGFLDSTRLATEGHFVWEPLPKGVRRIGSTCGRSGHGGPYAIVRNEATGECAILALAWSGNWFAEFESSGYPDDRFGTLENFPGNHRGINLRFSMGPDNPGHLRVIAPGETIVTPATHLAMMHASFDRCIQELHTHLRASVLPMAHSVYTVAGRVVEHPGEWILNEIDIAAEMGAECFVVDAGWYGDSFTGWWDRRGDWHEGDWIPGGLAACRERCRQYGMRFGLWMEPESVGPESRLVNEHPDWILHTDDGRQAAMALNLANPEVAAYVESWIRRLIQDHQVDFFKLDYNVFIYEGGENVVDGRVENAEWRHYAVLYSIFERIRRDFPDVTLENCASGGGRNDLGMLSRFHCASISDISAFPRSIRAINAMTLFLPPETLCYYHNHLHYAHQLADLDTHLRVSLFVRPIFVGFGAQNADKGTPHYAAVKRYIALHKERIRPILDGHPQVFHHTPDIGVQSPADWCVLEYASRDRLAGYAGVFRLGVPSPCRTLIASPTHEYLFKPRGLDPARRYRVTMDNADWTFECDGAELITRGISVHLDQAGTSELLLFQAIAPHT